MGDAVVRFLGAFGGLTEVAIKQRGGGHESDKHRKKRLVSALLFGLGGV